MARWISSYDYQSSAEWMHGLEPTKIGVLLRESSCYTGGIDDFDYDCIVAEVDEFSESNINSPDTGAIESPGVKYTLVVGNNYGAKKEFSTEPRAGEEAHMTLEKAMSNRQTPEAHDRAMQTNGRFERTVFLLMRGLQLINAT